MGKIKADGETVQIQGMFQFGKEFGDCDASPFVEKLLVWLDLAEIPFQYVPFKEHKMKKAPRGKVPVLGHRGEYVPDSELIIKYLTKEFDIKLDEHLTPLQQAQGHIIKVMFEENLYWSALIYPRWVNENGWKQVKYEYGAGLNLGNFLSSLVMPFARSGVIKSCKGHGMGLRSKEEIEASALSDMKALALLMEGKQFAVSDQPSSLDATVYGFLHCMIADKRFHDSSLAPCAEFILNDPTLSSYVKRMSELRAERRKAREGDGDGDGEEGKGKGKEGDTEEKKEDAE